MAVNLNRVSLRQDRRDFDLVLTGGTVNDRGVYVPAWRIWAKREESAIASETQIQVGNLQIEGAAAQASYLTYVYPSITLGQVIEDLGGFWEIDSREFLGRNEYMRLVCSLNTAVRRS